MRNPAKLLRLKKKYSGFVNRHPKLMRFMFHVSDNCLSEGSILDITITDVNGNSLHSNARLTAEDVEFMREVKALLAGKDE